MKPGSQNARLLAVLQDGRWHVSRELHDRCGYMRTNSRIAELRDFGRDHGFVIEGESVPGKTGTDGYRYRLTSVAPVADVQGAGAATLSAGPEAGANPQGSPTFSLGARAYAAPPIDGDPLAGTGANGVPSSLGASQASSALTTPAATSLTAHAAGALQLTLTDAVA